VVNDIEVVGEVCIQYGGLVGRHASNTLYIDKRQGWGAVYILK
jgi:hypothetical protein